MCNFRGGEGASVHLLNGPELHQHRQECLCHIHPAVLEEMLMQNEPVWHRHSCLCLGAVQCLILQPMLRVTRRVAATRPPASIPSPTPLNVAHRDTPSPFQRRAVPLRRDGAEKVPLAV